MESLSTTDLVYSEVQPDDPPGVGSVVLTILIQFFDIEGTQTYRVRARTTDPTARVIAAVRNHLFRLRPNYSIQYFVTAAPGFHREIDLIHHRFDDPNYPEMMARTFVLAGGHGHYATTAHLRLYRPLTLQQAQMLIDSTPESDVITLAFPGYLLGRSETGDEYNAGFLFSETFLLWTDDEVEAMKQWGQEHDPALDFIFIVDERPDKTSARNRWPVLFFVGDFREVTRLSDLTMVPIVEMLGYPWAPPPAGTPQRPFRRMFRDMFSGRLHDEWLADPDGHPLDLPCVMQWSPDERWVLQRYLRDDMERELPEGAIRWNRVVLRNPHNRSDRREPRNRGSRM